MVGTEARIQPTEILEFTFSNSTPEPCLDFAEDIT